MRGKTGAVSRACSALALAFLAGCPLPTAETPEADGEGAGTVVWDSTLFARDEDGTCEFSVRDTAYSGGNGYTFWTLAGSEQEAFTRYSARALKTSGNSAAGYGIVFCHGMTPDGRETMLLAMINTRGEYTVMEAVGGIARYLVEWSDSEFLNAGYGQSNTISVSLSEGEFTLSLNGRAVAAFEDEEEPRHAGGGNGFLAVISPLDDFPETPVTVVFKEE